MCMFASFFNFAGGFSSRSYNLQVSNLLQALAHWRRRTARAHVLLHASCDLPPEVTDRENGGRRSDSITKLAGKRPGRPAGSPAQRSGTLGSRQAGQLRWAAGRCRLASDQALQDNLARPSGIFAIRYVVFCIFSHRKTSSFFGPHRKTSSVVFFCNIVFDFLRNLFFS